MASSQREAIAIKDYRRAMIRQLELVHFKGFERFIATFEEKTVLIGPNNAGKSTLINALRTSAQMLRYAQRRRPELKEDRATGTSRFVYPFDGDPFDIGLVNIQHDFRPGPSSLKLAFDDPNLELQAEFPDEGDYSFSIVDPNTGWQPTAPKDLKPLGSLIGTIPPLVPIEDVETLLDARYVSRNVEGRLSSRHFRNQLWLLARGWGELFGGTYDSYLDLCRVWAPDVSLEEPEVRVGENGVELDVFYNEGRGPRELVWAGDGFQVWLQLLLHLMRLADQRTIILDEPEVFLHPDLQRRLVHLLDGISAQCIMATHSPEVAAEFGSDSVVLIDRSRPWTYRPSQADSSVDALGLGTRFNFALAKSLRASLTLFVEGDDLVVLRHIATTCGAQRLSKESGVAVVKLEGIDNRSRLRGFGWLVEKVLGSSMRGRVILDRDYRMPVLRQAMTEDLRAAGLEVHVWNRKEIESYLIEPFAIARLSGAPAEQVVTWLEQIADDLRAYVAAQYITVQQSNRPREQDASVAAQQAIEYLDGEWKSSAGGVWLCPARKLLTGLNTRLREAGYEDVSIHKLAKSLLEEEIPAEMNGLLQSIEEDLV